MYLLGTPFLLHWPCSTVLLLSMVLLSSCYHHDEGLSPDGPVPLENPLVPLLGTAAATCAFGYLSDCLEILPAAVQGRGFQARECCSQSVTVMILIVSVTVGFILGYLPIRDFLM